MANAKKGHVGAMLDGKPIKLALTFNAFCELEEFFAENVEAVLGRMETDPKFNDIRAVFWAAMLEDRPDATMKDAGRVIEENGVGLLEVLIDRAAFLADDSAGAPKKGDSPGN